MRRALICLLLVVLAGCAVPLAPTDDGTGNGTDGGSGFGVVGEGTGPATEVNSGDSADRIGRENGYQYDDPVPVNASDGLNESELDAVVSRAMARIEVIRDAEFTESVDVRVVSRAKYRQNQPFEMNGTSASWNNQVWEGLFVIGEDRNVSEVFEQTYGAAVLGYYSPGSGEIVVVSESAQAQVNRVTLVHELVHALQDQQFGLDESPPTQDRQLARNGVVEGEATLVERRYERHCGDEWNCVDTSGGAASAGSVDRGLLRVVRYPYVVGPSFVETVEAEGGWEAVSELHEDYPDSTEQVTHPSLYPGAEPIDVDVADRSSGEWRRFDHDPVADTLGQASITVMLRENGVVSPDSPYRHPATEGWGGDSLVPYRNGDRYGYVWALAWDTPEDAEQFLDAYRELLIGAGATRDGNVYTVPDSSSFGDAFRVTRDGDRVRIVNAPTVAELDDVGGPV